MPTIKVMPASEPLVCVVHDDDTDGANAAVIGVDRKGFLCHTCHYGKHLCSHVKLVDSLVRKDPIPDCFIDIVEKNSSLQRSNRNVYVKKTLSTRKITWKTLNLQRSVYNGTLTDALEEFSDGNLKCIPDFTYDMCNACGSELMEELFWKKGVKLLTHNGIKFVGG